MADPSDVGTEVGEQAGAERATQIGVVEEDDTGEWGEGLRMFGVSRVSGRRRSRYDSRHGSSVLCSHLAHGPEALRLAASPG